MKNIFLNTWENNSIVTSSADKLFKDKRILICSIHLPHNKLTHAYLKELTSCQEKYKNKGIEKIYIIDSYNDFWSMPIIDSFFPELTIVIDNNKQFINYLKDELNKEQPIEFLTKSWTYQLLLNNCKVEQFYEQPTEGRLADLKKYLMREHYAKLKNNKDPLPFSMPYFLNHEENLIFNSTNQMGVSRKKNMYYNIWPNLKLEKYLEVGRE
jgi:peroxiredoxin